MASTLTDFALQYNLPVPFLNPFSSRSKNPANLLISGDHFFTPEGVPFFNLETTDNKIGSISCKKLAETPAPEGATLGQGGVGEGTVAWLKLGVNDVSTGNLQEVYRLNTAGGKAPKTCEGMPPTFEVQYAAE